jgi:pimeloyl-ACP methyl ester carboxylesterase
MRTLTRRTLLGGGAVAAAGAGALVAGETERGRRWLHTVGIIEGPDLRPPEIDVPVHVRQLVSARAGRTVDWAISVPTEAPVAVIVSLHGRGGSHLTAFDTIGVHRFVAAEQLPWAVVGIDGGESSYWHARADGTDVEAMVFEELLPAVRQLVGGVRVLLLGWSMGGYGALLAASDHADEVTAVAAGSPALWPSFAQAAPGAFDDEADFERHDLFARTDALRRLPVRIDCGDDDPFLSTDRRLANTLPGAERAFGAGFHEDGFWRSRVPSQLAFFRRALTG